MLFGHKFNALKLSLNPQLWNIFLTLNFCTLLCSVNGDATKTFLFISRVGKGVVQAFWIPSTLMHYLNRFIPWVLQIFNYSHFEWLHLLNMLSNLGENADYRVTDLLLIYLELNCGVSPPSRSVKYLSTPTSFLFVHGSCCLQANGK
jgi:hypothetical protein